eukprot:CAMPEP_0175891674 /NCGR_PEP_ID=MMETSP0107_2-20121207/48508_1 /TAXON_ID=195067 ORGANISM="Goniomonas pacifica, Strain CCMP1869" /NCGR_SAMPLE_ID=MMETSP0107_2 /ASSEMBLY_ACC=CAM_ASM_000203 /LENGTH=115 /DNA_ID=CAMNT_0017212563 /DNA_START=237 /DNA_END=585 /DNA_ORIENTATION=-
MEGSRVVSRLQHRVGARDTTTVAGCLQEAVCTVMADLYRARVQSATDYEAIEDAGPRDGVPRLRFCCPIPLSEIDVRSETEKYCHVCRQSIQIVSKDRVGEPAKGGSRRCIAYQE